VSKYPTIWGMVIGALFLMTTLIAYADNPDELDLNLLQWIAGGLFNVGFGFGIGYVGNLGIMKLFGRNGND